MNRKYWEIFAYLYFMINTLCVIVLFELAIYGRPFLALFIIIFTLTLTFNWPFLKKEAL